MKNLHSGLVALAVLLSVGVSQADSGSQTGNRRGPGTGQGLDFDVVRWYINGLVEFQLAPPASMTPASYGYPRTAAKTADLFLQKNAEVLGIQQSVSDFSYLGSETQPCGDVLVKYAQNFHGYAVGSSYVNLTVTKDIVSRVEARFVSDVSKLVDCPGSPAGLAALGAAVATQLGSSAGPTTTTSKAFFQPAGTVTHFVVIVGVDVSNGELVTTLDACTGQLVDGYTEQTH